LRFLAEFFAGAKSWLFVSTRNCSSKVSFLFSTGCGTLHPFFFLQVKSDITQLKVFFHIAGVIPYFPLRLLPSFPSILPSGKGGTFFLKKRLRKSTFFFPRISVSPLGPPGLPFWLNSGPVGTPFSSRTPLPFFFSFPANRIRPVVISPIDPFGISPGSCW